MLLGGGLSLLLAGTAWASARGLWLPKPAKSPPSIREGSAKDNTSGRIRTRYFVGGGLRRGK